MLEEFLRIGKELLKICWQIISTFTPYNLYHTIAICSIIFLFLLLIAHFLSKIIRPPSLKLCSDSIVVLVGGCMGIGKVMAFEIAKKYKSKIVIVDRKKQLFDEISRQIVKRNGSCECLNYDLSDMGDVQKLTDYLKRNYPAIDLLLYNAGVFFPNYAWQVPDAQIQTLMNVNFFAPIKMIKQLLDNVEKSEGKHIAVTASVVSIIPGSKNVSSYISSKHAIYGYLNSLRFDLFQKNRKVTISIGCPYAINTTMFKGYKSRLDFILPILEEQYVGKRLVKQFVGKKQICFIGRRHAFIMRTLSYFPTCIIDEISRFIDVSNFEDRKKK